MFFGHTWELILVLIIALVFFGPKRLPELGSSLGKGIREFKKATNDLQESINNPTTQTTLPPEQHTTAGEYTHTNVEYTATPRSDKEPRV